MLAAVEGLIGQLAFLLFALLAWVLRSAQERKRARERAEALALRQALAAADGEPPHTLQERIDTRLTERAGPPPLPLPPPPEETYDEAYPTMPAKIHLQTTMRPPAAPSSIHHSFAPVSARAADMAPVRVSGVRTHALARLRIGDEPLSLVARRGVLWSEVLGPPRALRGPHRPPHMHRPTGA